MEHKIIITGLPDEHSLSGDMQPFYTVRTEKMSVREGKILVTKTVGVRCMGYFRAETTEEVSDATVYDALVYGLTTAQLHLASSPEDIEDLFTSRKDELINEANTSLLDSDSPVQLTEVLFSYVDYCIHDGSYGSSSQKYSGFVIGQSSTKEITVHRPKGIPGEWQCVCGAYSAPGEVCEECGIRRPVMNRPRSC